MKSGTLTVLILLSYASLAWGAWLMYHPLGFIVLGAELFSIAYATKEVLEEEAKKEEEDFEKENFK